MENEIRGDREKWAARKKRPRLRKRKARKRKGGINWANQSGSEDETGELKTHRDAAGRALRSHPIHPSSRTYVRTYIRLPAYLSDNAYRLIERDVLRHGAAACSLSRSIKPRSTVICRGYVTRTRSRNGSLPRPGKPRELEMTTKYQGSERN